MFIIFLLMLINTSNAFIHLPHFVDLKLNLVESASYILPKIDVFGHQILQQNKILIEKIIHMENITIETKKYLILNIIKLTEIGDSFGNIVLKNYENLVNTIL